MTDLRNQIRLAAAIGKCGRDRVWVDPDRLADVASAVTRADVKRLISGGAIVIRPTRGVSRGRARERAEKRKGGRRRGPGSRKGAKYARNPRKDRWMRLIRALRDELRGLRTAKKIDASHYRDYYMRAKGGQFRSRNHLLSHMKTEGLLKEGK
ncbi:MAG TPA: 50S ribosomal protein L19e [Candidatus Thermoplasmatota archaeon]|nr:50S ribosomal protein L19e [Candidatus Thermoplasmatota archaeon]